MDAEALFLEHLDDIQRIVGFIARRHGMPPEEAEEFASWAQLKLIEDDYAVIRKHRGESRLTTYLNVVLNHLVRDYRIKKWGRWRPSAKAKRLGTAAVRLETLTARDGLAAEEAVEMMVTHGETELPRSELRGLAEALPPRTRRRFEGPGEVERMGVSGEVESRVEDSERRRIHGRAEKVLERALATLDPDDLLLLKMYYRDGFKISEIAATLHTPQRPLYTRRDRSLEKLRVAFEDDGLGWQEVRRILGWEETELVAGWGKAAGKGDSASV